VKENERKNGEKKERLEEGNVKKRTTKGEKNGEAKER
jgi:hypothetical protein